jgi:hypothetical protein
VTSSDSHDGMFRAFAEHDPGGETDYVLEWRVRRYFLGETWKTGVAGWQEFSKQSGLGLGLRSRSMSGIVVKRGSVTTTAGLSFQVDDYLSSTSKLTYFHAGVDVRRPWVTWTSTAAVGLSESDRDESRIESSIWFTARQSRRLQLHVGGRYDQYLGVNTLRLSDSAWKFGVGASFTLLSTKAMPDSETPRGSE